MQHLLGHASVKTTSIYLASDEQRQEDVIAQRERGRLTIDEDLKQRAIGQAGRVLAHHGGNRPSPRRSTLRIGWFSE